MIQYHIDTTSVPDINPETGTRFDFTFLESPDASRALEDKQIGDELSPDSQELVTRTMSIIGPTIIAFTAPNN